MPIQTFYLKPTQYSRLWLRRYNGNLKCSNTKMSYHNKMNLIGDLPTEDDLIEYYHDDPRWPTVCECGYQFQDTDEWQLFHSQLFERTDNGELTTVHSAPVGAVWRSTWNEDRPNWCGLDGKSVHVKTPGGQWHIDGRASNCTMPLDTVHRCWVRHGSPEENNLHVDKNGNTCQAGAGSIVCGSYHGFLHNGMLTD